MIIQKAVKLAMEVFGQKLIDFYHTTEHLSKASEALFGKSIVKARLCRSGMRWSRLCGQRILYLRCFVKSSRWDVFWKQYIQLKLSA